MVSDGDRTPGDRPGTTSTADAKDTGPPPAPEDSAPSVAQAGGSRLGRLFRGISRAFSAPAPSTPRVLPDAVAPGEERYDLSCGDFDFPIVGESYRQSAIRRVAAMAERNDRGKLEFEAVVRREPTNKHDPNALAVYGPGRLHLGYVAREDAAALRRYFWRLEETGRVAVCRGIIIGEGKQSLGVVLDLDVKRLKREWKL